MRGCAGLFLMAFALSACLRQVPERLETNPGNLHAERFEILNAGNCQVLRVNKPWQNSGGISYSYVLGSDRTAVPDSLSDLLFIQTPVKRVVAMSTTHLAMLTQLGQISALKGLSGSSYVYHPEIRQRLETGQIREVGYGEALNYESIVELQPDVLFIYGVDGSNTAREQKLMQLGIPVVYCAEYLESHPLGKAEWIRFFAAFFEKGAEADSLFMQVAAVYGQLQDVVRGVPEAPSVLTGLPWKDSWFVAGGQSFAARLISDAGGRYLWAENSSREALPMDLESVYARALEADVWINAGVATCLGDLQVMDARFMDLPVVKAGHVYNNNKRLGPGGGNDYWESATVRPDLVLEDLIRIFHPGLLPKDEFTYYRKLK